MKSECPDEVRDYAEQTVKYVQNAMEQTLSYDSETLPLLDFYMKSVPTDEMAVVNLTAVTVGAYFGEVVRRTLGGHWQDDIGPDPMEWRLILPGGLTFVPSAMALCCMTKEDGDLVVDAPPKMMVLIKDALERMTDLSEEAFFSLAGRYDTLEHLQEVLLAIASHLSKDTKIRN